MSRSSDVATSRSPFPCISPCITLHIDTQPAAQPYNLVQSRRAHLSADDACNHNRSPVGRQCASLFDCFAVNFVLQSPRQHCMSSKDNAKHQCRHRPCTRSHLTDPSEYRHPIKCIPYPNNMPLKHDIYMMNTQSGSMI